MSKFNKRINEMLVVLNAVKKSKPKSTEEPKVDSVTDMMNNALGNFGMNVSNPIGADDNSEEEDPIEGSLEKMDDLDLPRPDDDEDEDGDSAFDFLNVGGPKEVDTNGQKDGDDGGSCEGENCDLDDKIKFEYVGGKGLVVSIGDSSATLSKEHVKTVKDFIDSLNVEDWGDDENGDNNSDNGEPNNDDDDE